MLKIISGQFRGRKLFTPKDSQTRPTQGSVRERLFNILQLDVPGSNFLDLFAGCGAVALEAISRGAQRAVLVESDRYALLSIRKNIELLGVESQTQVIGVDLYKALQTLPKGEFDLIFADPPYNLGHGKKVIQLIAEKGILKPGGKLFVEEGSEIEGEFEGMELVRIKKSGGTYLHEYRRNSETAAI